MAITLTAINTRDCTLPKTKEKGALSHVKLTLKNQKPMRRKRLRQNIEQIKNFAFIVKSLSNCPVFADRTVIYGANTQSTRTGS